MDIADWRSLVRTHVGPLELARQDDIVDELAQHLSDLYAEAIANGQAPAEAKALVEAALADEREQLGRRVMLATRALPGVIADRWNRRIDNAAGRASTSIWLAARIRDLRHGVRVLRRAPVFTSVAVATLALSIGANAAIFAAVDTVLLRPMPYPTADRIAVPVSALAARNIDNASVSFADYEEWRGHTEIFEAVAVFRRLYQDIASEDAPTRIVVVQAADGYFPALGVSPVAGRLIASSDYEPDAPDVVVISYALWRGRFAGSASIVGHTVRVSGRPKVVVGVLPPHADYPEGIDAVIPLRPQTLGTDERARRDNLVFEAIARLKPGVSQQQGTALVESIATRLARENPSARGGWTNHLVPLRAYMVSADLSRALLLLIACVGAVLLIGCANLANLALIRGLDRSREISIRLALGATRMRVVAQLLTESIVIAAVGFAGGVALSFWFVKLLVQIAPAGTPFLNQIAIDPRALGGAALLSCLAVVIAGLLPALATSRVRLIPALKDGSPASGASRRTSLLRQALVVAEIAGAVTMVICAGLLIRSFDRIWRTNPGFNPHGVLSARLVAAPPRYATDAAVTSFFARLTTDLNQSPAVASAGATSFVPLGGGGIGIGRAFLEDGTPQPPAGTDVGAQWTAAAPGYFETMAIPLLRGRGISERDRQDSTPVIVVSASFAAKMFGNRNPIGQRVRSWRDENVYREVVGVVADVKYGGLIDQDRSIVYVPHTQCPWPLMNMTVRARSGTAESIEPVLRSTIKAIDPAMGIIEVRTLDDVMSESVAQQRYTTTLVSLLAATALVLGGIGVFGVIGHAVSLRTKEFGLRAALGASRAQICLLVLRQGLIFTGLGLAIGIALSAFTSSVIGSLLYQTQLADAATYVGTVLIVLLCSVSACLVPALRAAKSDPLSALRTEG